AIFIGGLLAFFLLLGSGDASANWPVVSAVELQVWLDESDPPLILDVRGRADYHSKTIAGAMNAGVDPNGYLADGRGGRLVLLIRDEVNNENIAAWFSRLVNAGHEVWILQGGLAGWIEAGGATETPEFSYTRPGSVPFLIPRGLCEGGQPAHVFE
ncbi:MAG: rhodanese-like domain-containing protein, partial [Altibacter sp.]|nr:rhodanese-like domain-containing protein [Altibacter sp.]